MGNMKKGMAGVLMLTVFTAMLAGCSAMQGEKKKTGNPTVIEVETYYNGVAKIAMDELVSEFNDTVGDEKGIFVKTSSSGDMTELFESLEKELEKEPDERNLPDIFSCYGSNAIEFQKEGLLAELDDYFTEKELGEYVEEYIEEGRIGKKNKLYVFPIAKSTEVMTINKTDWDKFAQATGADIKRLSTWEGLAETAGDYYEWSQGRALFGRDAFANYMLTGLHQLGADIFQVENDNVEVSLNKTALKKLWDNYYAPFIKGYYTEVGRFRSDDMKTGDLIAAIGSSAAGSYYAQEVTIGDQDPYPIETMVLPVPGFDGKDPVVPQQGAGMAVVKSEKEKEKASVEFLKWITDIEPNSRFSMASSYLPVKKAANDIESIEKIVKKYDLDWSDMVRDTLDQAFRECNEYDLYTMTPFKGSDDCRAILDTSLREKAMADREKVKERVEAGKTPEEAAAEYLTDKNFDGWVNDLEGKLKGSIQG